MRKINMATTNDITGDLIKSKQNNKAYSDGWDRIFGNKEVEQKKTIDEPDHTVPPPSEH